MRRIRYSVATSLDGYVAGPKGEADRIVMDPELDFRELFAQFDAVLVGRKTFETMLGQGRGGGMGMPTYVFSRTLRQSDHPKVTIVAGGARETLTALRKQPGKDIWLMGGGELCKSLLELGLVDTIEVAIVPVILGGGIPLVPAPCKRSKLALTKQRAYAKTGTVSLAYDVKKARS